MLLFEVRSLKIPPADQSISSVNEVTMYAQGQQHPYSYMAGFGMPMTQQPMPTQLMATQMPQIATRAAAGFGTNKDKLSNDTSSRDPELLKSRVFIGNLNSNQCTRSELIDLCQPYGNLKSLSLLKGYAFVQYEAQAEAEMAIKILNGYNFYNQKLDVRLAAIGKGSVISGNSNTGPVRRPKHDFLFGGQRIRVETTNVRNRTFSQDVFGAMKDVNFYDHGLLQRTTQLFVARAVQFLHRSNRTLSIGVKRNANSLSGDVAPSVVSCFTCKEEFNEPWLFIQHLIHRHSINLYRDQPESDPVSYIAKTKAEQGVIEKKEATPANKASDQPATEAQNGTNGESGKSAETTQQTEAGSKSPDDLMIIEQPAADNNDKEIKLSPKSPEKADQEVNKEDATSSAMDDVPSYSSAISIGVSGRNQPTYVSVASSAYLQPSFHAPPPFQRQTQPTYPTYQFTQPMVTVSSIQPGFPISQYVSAMPPTTHASQVSLSQFMAQSNATNANQGGLSEEEQLKLLEELDNV
ncbi:RRM domain-containing protein [Aphelenchoides bicaudatus]|nr:RRM domain-containing protein [Aphelenchoides bicaudatus]